MRSVIVAAVMMVWLLMGCRGMETWMNRGPSGSSPPPGPGGPLMPVPDPSFSPAAPLHGPAFPSTSYHAPPVRSNGTIPVHGSSHRSPTLALPRTVAPSPPNRWTAPVGSLTAPGEPALFPPGSYRELSSSR